MSTDAPITDPPLSPAAPPGEGEPVGAGSHPSVHSSIAVDGDGWTRPYGDGKSYRILPECRAGAASKLSAWLPKPRQRGTSTKSPHSPCSEAAPARRSHRSPHFSCPAGCRSLPADSPQLRFLLSLRPRY